jgi:hypothetical protein
LGYVERGVTHPAATAPKMFKIRALSAQEWDARASTVRKAGKLPVKL